LILGSFHFVQLDSTADVKTIIKRRTESNVISLHVKNNMYVGISYLIVSILFGN